MEDASSLECLYQAVLKDFILVFVQIMKEIDKIEEQKDEEELKFENMPIEELLKHCFKYIKHPSLSKAANTYYPEIYELINKYLDNINDLIEGKNKIENFLILKAGEHDIYLSYGILCSFRIITGGLDLQEFSKFNYKEWPNFKYFIDLYGNSKNLTKNYEANFKTHKKDKKELDLKIINSWIKKLDEKQLSPMKKKNKKKNKQNEEKIDTIDDNKNKINENKNEVDVNPEKQTSINQNNIGEKNEIKELNVDNENNNKILNTIGKNNVGNNALIESEEKSKTHFDKVNIEIKNDKIPLVPIVDKNKIINEEKNQVLSNIMKDKKNEEFKDDMSIQNQKDVSGIKGEDNEVTNINTNLNPNYEIQTTKNKENKEDDNPVLSLIKEMEKNQDQMKKKIEDLEKEVTGYKTEVTGLKEEVTGYKKEVTGLKEEINGLKEEKRDINKRVSKLEMNQLLLYHQIGMYQNSRDIYKSIYTYYFQYLNLKRICPNSFEKLKAVIDYTKEEDSDKLKAMQYDETKKIPDKLKIKLTNYFKLHFFLNKVSNKIVHRNFSEEQKRILKEQNNDNDNLLPLIADFDFDQCFKTLEFFIENNANNKQIKKAIEIVYNERYIKDDKLGSIRDDEGSVIKKDENGVHIIFKKEDLEEIRNHFNSIDINNVSFVKLCNDKLWDKEEF